MSEAKHSPLLPCPFCGKAPVMLAAHENDSFVRGYSVRCDECGIEISEEYEDDAVIAWNRRSATSLHHELVAALETALSQWSMYADLIGRKDEDVCLLDEQSMEGTLYRHVRALLQKAKQGDKP